MKHLNRRLALSVFWVVLGGVLLALSLAEVLDSTLYAGMGGGLMAVGAFQCLRNLRYRRDAAYRETVDIETEDERNRFLRMKSWSIAGYLVVLLEAVGMVVALVLGQELIQQVLSCSVCLILVAYWGAYLFLSRKY